jgi:hypothetical protein
MSPRDVREALGKVKVCTPEVEEEVIVKSVPEEVAEKV